MSTHKKENLKEKVLELEASWKRALADYQNLQKRVIEERIQIGAHANEMLLRKMLPVLDNLEKIEEHLNDSGLKITIKEFKQILKESGLLEVETDQKDFNPHEMEATDAIEGEKNKVLKTLQKGYFLNGKLIRPARVLVGRGIGE